MSSQTARELRELRRKNRELEATIEILKAASRLMHRLARRPPAEAEAEYYTHLQVGQHTHHT